jgi:uncharacterized protein YceH (UPF0502 family)
VHFSELSPVEQRVLGCLIEKRWTTPEQYPLSINALRLACNQATNRDPVTHYDENDVRDAAQRLSKYGLARLASGHNSRAVKYRHLAEESLGVDREHLAVLAVLLLRGPQTPGELNQRSERMAPIPTLAEVERVLGELGQLGYATRLERRPGQKEDRYAQLLGGAGDEPAAAPVGPAAPVAATTPVGAPMPVAAPTPSFDQAAPRADTASSAPTPLRAAPPPAPAPPAPAPPAPPAADVADLQARVAALEDDLAQLRAQLSDLLS